MKRSLPAPLDRWYVARDAIYRDVFESFWDPARRTFVQRKGAKTTDAATLLMPVVKFMCPATGRRMQRRTASPERVDKASRST